MLAPMRWDPWAAAAQRSDLEIRFGSVPTGAAWYREPDRDIIVIDHTADRRQRRAWLTHELIHIERSVGFPAATAATMEHEEAVVRRETARRLVPQDELASYIRQYSRVENVTVALVAEQFDVPLDVAAEALKRAEAGDRAGTDWCQG